MALQKYVPSGDAPTVNMKRLSFSTKGAEKTQLNVANQNHNMNVDVDLREVYFLILHFLSAGPCHKTCLQFWNELLEHELLPRRYHSWYSRSGACSGNADDDGLSFPLSYDKLVERYLHCFFFDCYLYSVTSDQNFYVSLLLDDLFIDVIINYYTGILTLKRTT